MIPVQNITANGNYPTDGGVIHNGDTSRGSAKNTVHATGGFGAGTVVLQFKPFGSSLWRPLSDVAASLTAAGEYNFELRGSCHIRLNVSGATAPTIEAGVL